PRSPPPPYRRAGSDPGEPWPVIVPDDASDRQASAEEVRLGPFPSLTVQDGVDAFVVEGDEPGDGQELTGGEVIRPGQVGMDGLADPDRPVAAGRPLVRAGGHRVGRDQM